MIECSKRGCLMKREILAAVMIGAAAAWAAPFTFNVGGESVNVDIPADIAGIVADNYGNIQNALTTSAVGRDDFLKAVDTLNDKYTDVLGSFGNNNPYTAITNGLDDFCDDLCDTIPNTQTLQNVWAQSWIGMLIPGIHFGLGVDAGIAMLNVESLKDAASALSIDASDLPDNLVFPTATLDARIGGFFLPFDIGFTISSIDSSKIGALDSAIDPCGFEYFSIGGDLRYKLLDTGGKVFNARVSVSAGGYYTKGSVDVSDSHSSSKASMDYNSTMLFVGAQASAKALCFIPFLGTRIAFTKTKVDWDADADWENILGTSVYDAAGYMDVANVVNWGILPSRFGGDASSGWKVRPQVYGGIGFDLFVIDLTISASYDIVAGIPGAALSLRLSI